MKRAATAIAAVFLCVLACASVSAQSVVVNKYQNSGTTADIVELLVIQDALDMRGMYLKDFSSNMANDGGGKYQFSNDALWSAVPAGTLIVLRNNNSAADVTAGSGDFNIDVGLQNTTYFTNAGGTFDIATTEMVMIKTAASGAAGVTGNIHTLAGGTAGAQFTSTTGPKLRATGTSGTGQFVYANSSTQTLADYNGTDATGAATGLTFGAGNNPNNTAYINSLRVTGPAAEPTVQASNLTFSNIGATSMTVSWTNGNGSGRLVLARQGSPVDAAPADGTSYTANSAYGSGSEILPPAAPTTSSRPVTTTARPTTTQTTTRATTFSKLSSVSTSSASNTTTSTNDTTNVIGAPTVSAVGGNFVVFAGTGNSVTVTNLQPSTTYYFAVFEYNGSNAGINYLTTNPPTGGQITAVGYQISGVVRSQGGSGLSNVTVTLASGDTPLANAVTDSEGNYSFPNVTAGGDYTVTPSSPSFTFSPPSTSFSSLSGNQTADFTGIPRIIISEFRFHGTDPDGAGAQTASANEFVELYNQTDENVTVTGWTLRASTGTTLLTFPAVIIPARSHYLVGGTSYGLAAYAAANSTLAADIPDGAGVALFNNGSTFDASTRLDAVGFSGVADAVYREGAGMSPAGGVTTDGEVTFLRRWSNGVPVDTDDNDANFIFLSTDGGVYNARQSGLGAPGPENTSSPIQRNSQVGLTLLDPAVSSTQSPNRTRDFTADLANNSAFGTMSIRRTLTNLTGSNITRLRFRLADVTTYPASGSYADLRARTSGSVVVTVTGGANKTVQGTTLEEPPAQPNGGGNNATLAAGTVTLAQPLANGQSVDLQFLVGVMTTGTYRFFLNVEAVTQATASANEHLTMGNPSNAVTDVNQPANYLMEKPQYALAYNRDRGGPIWTSWHLDSTWTTGSGTRQDDFRADTTLPAGWYQVQGTDFSGSGFDRGHMCPSADRLRTNADNSATFLMTNMVPQSPDNNQGPWANMENYLRTLVGAGNELYIISGGSGQGGTGSNGGTTNTVASGHVVVPSQTWKVVIVIPVGTDDVNRVTTSTRTIAVIMPNTQGIRTVDWKTYRVSVDQVEALTGFDFFSNVPVATQAAIESVVDNQ
ncbi:MAG: DNA/RNA non-specific endonuclease [Pyrinomonadaceae bacterium]